MKRQGYQLRRIAAGIAALGFSLQAVQAQSSEVIIEQFRQATGGGKALQAYSTVLRPVGEAGPAATLYRTAAGQYRLETAVSCQCFDGKVYRSRETGAPHPAKPADVLTGVSYPSAFTEAVAKTGIVDDDGKPCYRVSLGKDEYFLNPKTYLPYKVVRKTAGGKGNTTEEYADYRAESGYMIPHYVRSGGKEYILSDFRVNPDLPADWFACGKAR